MLKRWVLVLEMLLIAGLMALGYAQMIGSLF